MGNRALLVPKNSIGDRGPVVAIYVHWYDEDALDEAYEKMKVLGYRNVIEDPSYGMARLCQTLCEIYEDGLNIGLDVVDFGDPKGVVETAEWLDEGIILIGDFDEDFEKLDIEAWKEEYGC